MVTFKSKVKQTQSKDTEDNVSTFRLALALKCCATKELFVSLEVFGIDHATQSPETARDCHSFTPVPYGLGKFD